VKNSGADIKNLEIKSPSFKNNGNMLKKHTRFDADISPEFQLLNLCTYTGSITIVMDDLDNSVRKICLKRWADISSKQEASLVNTRDRKFIQ
jgi:phosphatidylethanolamine-binding protein (PEBP) family uncharacterized protein